MVGGVGVFKPGTFIGDFQSIKEKIIYVIKRHTCYCFILEMHTYTMFDNLLTNLCQAYTDYCLSASPCKFL